MKALFRKTIMSFALVCIVVNAYSQTIEAKISFDFAAQKPDLAEVALSDWNYNNSFSYSKKMKQGVVENVQLEHLHWKAIPFNEKISNSCTESVQYFYNNAEKGLENVFRIHIFPYKKERNQLFQLLSCDMKYSINIAEREKNFPPYTNNSILNGNEVYKIAVSSDGVYKITKSFLNNLGVNLNGINPSHIKIYGNGIGLLPEPNNIARPDDIQECKIWQKGLEDGVFDNNDYILFYAKGANDWQYNATNGFYERQNNYYETKNHYYIVLSDSPASLIQTEVAPPIYNIEFSTYDTYAHHEIDKFNFNKSGKIFLGESFEYDTEQNFNLTLPNVSSNSDLKVMVDVATRSILTASNFAVKCNGTSIGTLQPTHVQDVYYGIKYERDRKVFVIDDVSGNYNLSLTFNKARSDAKGWLNYITLNGKSNLVFNGNTILCSNTFSIGQSNISKFNITGNLSDAMVWDVTSHNYVKRINVQNNAFIAETPVLKRFAIFNPNNASEPEAIGKTTSQNIHGMDIPDMIIVYNKDFENAAQTLKNHRVSFNNFDVQTIELQKVYNEFSCGNTDLTAIRDMCKMFFDRDAMNGTQKFKYLLLLGKASYDYKSVQETNGNTNFVPTFETAESKFNVNSFPTDDFFGLLSMNEGFNVGNDGGLLDIAVGRIPARSADEALGCVQKIINYETNPENLGSWRIKSTFVGDDEDTNDHMEDANYLADLNGSLDKNINVNKILIDAYLQVSTSGGQSYPEAHADILNDINNGTLLISYSGHGGPTTWAEERIFTVEDIPTLKNSKNLPLFITATCEFAPFDWVENSGGELLFNKTDGGASALFTTTRAVYQFANRQLVSSVVNRMFTDQATLRTEGVGQILSEVKVGVDIQNARKFALLGDPAMKLAYPKLNVVTTKINNVDANSPNIDTLKSLSTITIEGEIRDTNDNLADFFNGVIEPTIFDKATTFRTRNNDNSPAGSIDFQLQKSIIYKGLAEVRNGKFRFTFMVPREINYNYGKGKISYYAKENGTLNDAAGYFNAITIGGTSNNVLADNLPPEIELYLNDSTFISGGITDASPIVYAKLSDDTGINYTGNAVGHDIVAIIDNDPNQTYILNNYFTPELGNNNRGSVLYPLYNLSEGEHSLSLEAWDLNNNFAKTNITFFVKNGSLTIGEVFNYPNPLRDNTTISVGINKAGIKIDSKLQIFSITGSLLYEMEQNTTPSGYNIEFKLKDLPLSKGMYPYRIQLKEEGTDKYLSKTNKMVVN